MVDNHCMDIIQFLYMATINISLPTTMYQDAKAVRKLRGYASISELIRHALRDVLYPRVTENGFTPAFEKKVLQAEKDANAGDVVKWNGKGSFADFVLKNPPQSHDKSRIHRSILSKRNKTA